jgi:hypothetical protein
LADGGFGSVYKATWSKGWRGFGSTKHNYPGKRLVKATRKSGDSVVSLKTLNIGETVTTEFLNEVNAARSISIDH